MPDETAIYELPYITNQHGSPEVKWKDAMDKIEAALVALGGGGGGGTNALLEGRLGGQHLHGGTAASNDLTLSSTDHATKGHVYFGDGPDSAFDETNNRLGIGVLAPNAPLHIRGVPSGENKPQLQFEPSDGANTLVAGGMDYASYFRYQDIDGVTRYSVLATNENVTATAAPYTNHGYIEVYIHGELRRLMVTNG